MLSWYAVIVEDGNDVCHRLYFRAENFHNAYNKALDIFSADKVKIIEVKLEEPKVEE